MKQRIGVVGVGTAWESRHRPALLALSDRFELCAVCDPVRHLAEEVARQFDAAVHDGYRALTSRDDIDAVLLLSAKFYGATPIYAACDAGKAVYCAAALELEDEQASSLRNRVEESGIAFMAEFPCRLSPATLRLKELIATKLGAPRLLFCNRRRTCASENEKRDRCSRDLVELVDWCRYVIDAEPTSLVATGHLAPQGEQQDYLSLSLDFSPEGIIGVGPLANIRCGNYVPESLQESVAYRRPADLKVVCQRGIAFVDLPNTVAWFDEAGQHLETLDHERPVGEQLLLHFHRAIESLVLKSSSLADAHRAITIANQAKQSFQTGQRVSSL
ncbi:MAG: Gfo/Idh/MocA family oxidoreductase [Pirellulales bacterium]|nr:Gfo/Idh/MocA family oxidoreductase [Pirellulales bacterium]